MTKININQIHSIIIGQILGDAHLEKVYKNCRISFSFGNKYKDYAIWIQDLFQDYCNKGIYSVNIQNKEKKYLNYRLKTSTLEKFTIYHNQFYQFNPINNRYKKIIPNDIIINPISLSHI